MFCFLNSINNNNGNSVYCSSVTALAHILVIHEMNSSAYSGDLTPRQFVEEEEEEEAGEQNYIYIYTTPNTSGVNRLEWLMNRVSSDVVGVDDELLLCRPYMPTMTSDDAQKPREYFLGKNIQVYIIKLRDSCRHLKCGRASAIYLIFSSRPIYSIIRCDVTSVENI